MLETAVFFKGLPKFISKRGVLNALRKVVPGIKQILMPKKSASENRHFGFIICNNKKTQQKLLKMQKLRGGKLKLDFGEYNPRGEEDVEADHNLADLSYTMKATEKKNLECKPLQVPN